MTETFPVWLLRQILYWRKDFWVEIHRDRALINFVVKGAVMSSFPLGEAEAKLLGVTMEKSESVHERATVEMRPMRVSQADVGGPCPGCGKRSFVQVKTGTVDMVTGEILFLGLECVCGAVTEWPVKLSSSAEAEVDANIDK